jgi:AcrR family transcriptional regulator
MTPETLAYDLGTRIRTAGTLFRMASAGAERRTQRERAETTRRDLVRSARALFATKGYAGTTLEAVVQASGVTKGALYHHFGGKVELFEAVYEEEQRRLALAVRAAASRRRDPWHGVIAGCCAFLDESLEEGVQLITLLDAPSALGFERMREIEEDHGVKLLRRGVAAAVESGRLGPRADAESLSELIYGALCQAALHVARAADPRAAERAMVRQLKAMLSSLER